MEGDRQVIVRSHLSLAACPLCCGARCHGSSTSVAYSIRYLPLTAPLHQHHVLYDVDVAELHLKDRGNDCGMLRKWGVAGQCGASASAPHLLTLNSRCSVQVLE